MKGYRVTYPANEWSKGAAWDHLREQMIPGCPKVWRQKAGVWAHGWRKDHDYGPNGVWAYVYEGGGDAHPIEEQSQVELTTALGVKLYREGWRQASNKYRAIARGKEWRELDAHTFKAFKEEAKRAWEENALCSAYEPECKGGEIRKLTAFLSRKVGSRLMCDAVKAQCQPRPGRE